MKRLGDLLGAPSAGNGSGTPNGSARREDPCPICKGKGFLLRDVPADDPDFGRAFPCRCTQAKMVADRSRNLQQVSNLGQLSRMTFDNFLPEGVGLPDLMRYNLRQAFDLAMEFARDPQGWLVFRGGYGCGKTHLAAAIANHRIGQGQSVLFIVVPDLLDYLRAAYAPTSTITYDERLENIREAPLLILDDLGAQNSTPWAQEKLFQILNHRYNGRLPTVITSNLRLEDLDPRVCSRLVDPDLSQVYEMVVPDFRSAGPERSGGLNTLSLHHDQTLDNFSTRIDELPEPESDNLERALSIARDYAADPDGWLVFTGTYGCGKTHLAAAIANAQRDPSRVPMFVVVPDLLDHLRATFGPTSNTTLDKAFEQVRTTGLLVLDDLGTESATPWAREKLFQLLNHRYVARLPTVITTANSIEHVDPRLRSRMLDSVRCTVFALEAPSYRGSARRERGAYASWDAWPPARLVAPGAETARARPHDSRATPQLSSVSVSQAARVMS